MAKPYVYLIGAGPGELDLITVKGRECIQKADVILFDYLVNPELLQYKKAGAQVVYVGKSAGFHEYSQEEINSLLVNTALEGKRVARLKGGDPYVFGRGGEEALALRAAGIAFEVVPGISSAIGALNYAGIPVTHRNLSTSFHVITGHEHPHKPEGTVNYQALAQLEGTLIFLMGISHLDTICRQLLQYGKDGATPAALVYRGTSSQQRVWKGTLESLPQLAKQEGVRPPAIIVVGQVVALQEQLNWFERMPLFGKRILVTRTREQAGRLSRLLAEKGAEVVEVPAIQVVPLPFQELEPYLERIKQAHYLVFTSVNGVHTFFQAWRALKQDLRSLARCRIAAVGPMTAAALEGYGLFPDLMGASYSGEGLADLLKTQVQPDEQVVLLTAKETHQAIPRALASLGTQVLELPLYVTTGPREGEEKLVKQLQQGIDIITFASSSAVTHLLELLGRERRGLLANSKMAAIGPMTARTLQENGITVTYQGKENTLQALVDAIIEEG